MATDLAFNPTRTYLEANWTTTTLVFENEDWPTPATPECFVYVEMFGSFYDQISIGADPQTANLSREAGVLKMHVMTPKGAGTATARQYARQLANLFRMQEISGIVFRDADIGADEVTVPNGNYFALTASVDWLRDE